MESSLSLIHISVAHAGKDDTGEHQRSRNPHLVAVHQGRTVLTRLPLVGTVYFDVPALTTAEYVVLGDGEGGTGARLVVALHGDVEVEFGIVGLVQSGNYTQVERIGDEGGIARHILHFGIAEDAKIGKALLHTGLAIKAVQALHGALAGDTGTVLHLALPAVALVVEPAVKHIGAHAQLVVVVDGEPLVVDAVIGFLALLAEKDVYKRQPLHTSSSPHHLPSPLPPTISLPRLMQANLRG